MADEGQGGLGKQARGALRLTFRATVELARELRHRTKDCAPALRAAAFPAMLAAVRAER